MTHKKNQRKNPLDQPNRLVKIPQQKSIYFLWLKKFSKKIPLYDKKALKKTRIGRNGNKW